MHPQTLALPFRFDLLQYNVLMAESAGLALGAIGVAALFNNDIECFQLVRIGQDSERDTETYQIRLNLLQLRLSQ